MAGAKRSTCCGELRTLAFRPPQARTAFALLSILPARTRSLLPARPRLPVTQRGVSQLTLHHPNIAGHTGARLAPLIEAPAPLCREEHPAIAWRKILGSGEEAQDRSKGFACRGETRKCFPSADHSLPEAEYDVAQSKRQSLGPT